MNRFWSRGLVLHLFLLTYDGTLSAVKQAVKCVSFVKKMCLEVLKISYFCYCLMIIYNKMMMKIRLYLRKKDNTRLQKKENDGLIF
jgi:hypothetical protein